jgi:hypothetical protein
MSGFRCGPVGVTVDFVVVVVAFLFGFCVCRYGNRKVEREEGPVWMLVWFIRSQKDI